MKTLRDDFRASIVVFLVALPLGMGISIASGFPPAAGLITGIIGGIVVGLISGSPLQVSGAAAGLTVIVYDAVQRFGLQQVGLVVAAAGLMQLAGGFLRCGRWFRAVSPTVIYGMLAGIGALIIGGQFHVMFDLAPVGGGLANFSAIPTTLAKSLESGPSLAAGMIGAMTIAVMAGWPKLAQLSDKLRLVPAPLVAVVLAALVTSIFGLAVQTVNIPADLFSAELAILSGVDMSLLWRQPELLVTALELALIASAESLLCAAAVDQLHDGPRTQYDKELTAQGVGNTLCGLLGVLPMTGVIVRSSANLQAGAKTRWSAVFHGVWLLLFIALLPGVLSYVPTASLAGILVFTGFKLVSPAVIRTIAKSGRGELFVYITTVALIVVQDLLTGVVVGLALAGIRLLLSLSRLSATAERRNDDGSLIVKLQGAATFLRLPTLAATLDSLPGGQRVILHTDELGHVDRACADHLQNWSKRYETAGGKVEWTAPPSALRARTSS